MGSLFDAGWSGRRGGGQSKQSLFMLYLDVVSISNSKELKKGKMDLVQYTENELFAIDEIANEDQLFPLLVNSLCPAIYGHEVIKGLPFSVSSFFHVNKYFPPDSRCPPPSFDASVVPDAVLV